MVLLAHAFLHEPLGPLRITGIVLCIAGIVAIVARGDLATLRGLAINRGDVWALARHETDDLSEFHHSSSSTSTIPTHAGQA